MPSTWDKEQLLGDDHEDDEVLFTALLLALIKCSLSYLMSDD